MKILSVIFVFFCLFSPLTLNEKCSAIDDEISYAKIKEDCLLFKTNDTDLILHSNVYFTLPKGYFVSIITNITSEIVKVRYGNFTGFVKSNKIAKVSGKPKTATLTGITFDLLDSSSTHIRTSPTTEDQTNILHIIPASTQNITYIAETIGEIPPSGKSNIWYFVEYSPESDPVSVYHGYVYSEKTKNLTAIPENTEFQEAYSALENNESAPDYIYLSGGVKVLLVCITSLPLLAIFVLLFFQSRKNKTSVDNITNKIFSRKKPQKTAKNDEIVPNFPSYEFDDDDLL